jgi:hypothetical protein
MIRSSRNPFPIALLLAALCALPIAAEEPPTPDRFEGLVAWYRGDLSAEDLDEKGAVNRWPDRSGNGHDLSRDGDNRAAVARGEELNGHPVVDIENGSFAVASPFALDDHTIFVVARSKYGDQALFRGDDAWSRGVVLYQNGRRHVIRTGGVGSDSPPYSDTLGRELEFALTVLGRDAKVLRAWVDGTDLSSWTRSDEPLEVGALFHIELSQFVDRGGKGLEVAEMLFYDRFLEDEERHAVSSYLATKYGLRLRESVALTLPERMERLTDDRKRKLAWLLPKDQGNLNDPAGHRVVWGGDSRKLPAFRHEEGERGSRIYSTQDGAELYLYLSLPLEVEGPGLQLRALVLRNGAEYLEEDGETPVLSATGSLELDRLELEADLTLDAGDYIEVIVFQVGGPGAVTIGPDPAGLVLELR